MLRMFHWLEEQIDSKEDEHLPPMFRKMLQDIVVLLSQLPFVNSLVYVPTSLYCKQAGSHFWKEATLNGDFHTNTPIIGAQHLTDLELFQQFALRIKLIGFE